MAQRDSQRPHPEEPRSGLEEPAPSLSRGRSRRRKRGCAEFSFETPRSARLLRMRSVGFGAILKAATLGAMARFLLRLKTFALIALLVLCASAHATEEDKGVLANLISRALSSPGMSVSIGAVNGVLSSDASISDIVISDRQGPWLKVDKARLVWNRLALFSRRLEVDQLTIGRIEFLRRPLPSDTPPPDTGAQQPILPFAATALADAHREDAVRNGVEIGANLLQRIGLAVDDRLQQAN